MCLCVWIIHVVQHVCVTRGYAIFVWPPSAITADQSEQWTTIKLKHSLSMCVMCNVKWNETKWMAKRMAKSIGRQTPRRSAAHIPSSDEVKWTVIKTKCNCNSHRMILYLVRTTYIPIPIPCSAPMPRPASTTDAKLMMAMTYCQQIARSTFFLFSPAKEKTKEKNSWKKPISHSDNGHTFVVTRPNTPWP